MNRFKQINQYEQNYKAEDFISISEALVQEADDANKVIETDAGKLKHMIKNDLRDNIPPQIYALIGLISATIESLEKDQGMKKSNEVK